MRRFVRRDERAGETRRDGPAASNFDAKSDREVHRQTRDARGIPEQCVKRLEMIPDWLSRLLEPGENSTITLVENAVPRAHLKPCDNLLDQLALSVGWQGRDDLLIIEHARGDERQLAGVAIGAERVEVRKIGNRIEQPPRPISTPAQHSGDDQQNEQPRGDVGENEIGFEKCRTGGQYRSCRSEQDEAVGEPLAKHGCGAQGQGDEETRKPAEIHRGTAC